MSPKRRRFLLTSTSLGLAAALGLVACHKDQDLGPDWLRSVDISVQKARPAFDDHTELFISIHNKSAATVTIEHLEDAAKLERVSGSASKIHHISVGVAKPIKVAASSTKDTSLLFQAGPGAPKRLHLYGRAFDVPASAGP
jgi:hypothetical protein